MIRLAEGGNGGKWRNWEMGNCAIIWVALVGNGWKLTRRLEATKQKQKRKKEAKTNITWTFLA